jgi:haloacetate dehalogenase
MADLADLFPGFASHWIDTEAGKIFARSGGAGPPLLLLHGFPQTHVMWHRVAPQLAKHFSVVLMDLRGYGWSSAPASTHGQAYSKRLMAQDAVQVMEALGHIRFRMVGHDRGARVGYRLAFDHPGRLEKLGLIDIIPTLAMWRGMDAKRAMQAYHWLFLAQPEPLPENLIGKAPRDYLDHTLASWTANKDLRAFDARAIAHYRAFFEDPTRIHACCEDYRAGATIDHDLDETDHSAGRKIDVPLQVLWGTSGIPAQGAAPLEVWKEWADDVQGAGLEGGHFLPEENPDAVLAALTTFLA